MNPKKLLLFIRSIRIAYKLFFDWLDQARTNEVVDAKIRELGFLTPRDESAGIIGSPSCDVGTALRLASRWGVQLAAGTASNSQCQASLHKDMWQGLIDPDKKSGEFGGFFADTSHDEIDSIDGYGCTINEAVCRCLINCRTAGVL